MSKVSAVDAKISSKLFFQTDKLLPYLQVFGLDIEKKEARVTLWENIQRGLTTFLSLHEIERTPVQIYLENY